MKTLSILMPVIPAHMDMMQALIESIKAQQGADEVEIIYELSPHKDDGGPPRGQKRNMLLFKSRGKYVAFVDSDDRVSDGTEHPAYVPTILKAVETNPDVVGMQGLLRFNGDPDLWFEHSIRNSIEWYDDSATAPPGQAKYWRSPNHLNPVRKELAMKARFVDSMQRSEDHDYARRLLPLLKMENYIPHPIYYYIK